MKWALKDTTSQKAGFFSMLMTFVCFTLGTALGIVVYPFANYYLINNALPNSDEAKAIFNGLADNATSIFLSCIIGGFMALISIFSFRLGRYTSTFVTLLEQIVIYSALYYLSIWIMYKVNDVPSDTIILMIPYFVYQLAAFITLEIAAIMCQSGRVAYNFLGLSALVGCMIGILRSVDLNYFPTSIVIAFNSTMGLALARSALDTSFFFGACVIAGASIARSKIGGSFFWHLVGLVLSIGLACAYATSSRIADDVITIMSTDAARWAVAVVVSVVTNIVAVSIFWPIHKQAKVVANNENRPFRSQAGNGPIVANAVVLV